MHIIISNICQLQVLKIFDKQILNLQSLLLRITSDYQFSLTMIPQMKCRAKILANFYRHISSLRYLVDRKQISFMFKIIAS